jgi:S-DNA-T family DNA segregation ATPase FtsK/SpoIIIE
MLFTPPGSSDLMRAQGAFVSDEETYAIIEAVKQNGPPDYRLEMQQQIENDDNEKGDKGSEYSDVIPLFPKVLDIFQTTKKVSASILITKLVIGYPKATRIMMALEELGYISPANGSKPRQVLKDSVDEDY